MNEFPFTPRQFMWFLLAAAATMFAAAAFVRKAQRLPFFRPEFPDAEVQENWRSAASSLGFLGSFARANNCIWFVLTKDALHVGPHFPFNLFMPPFIAGLDLRIPIAAMSSVSEETSVIGGDRVRVRYDLKDEARGIVRTEHVDLWPARHERWVFALNEKIRAEARKHPD